MSINICTNCFNVILVRFDPFDNTGATLGVVAELFRAFLVTQETGGSGIFYYAVVALKTANGYKTTNAFFIGDRIAPQTTEINTSAKELYVNFAERKPGEPMTAQPSQGATLYLKVTPAGVLEGLMN